jgi:hypothetical protein
MSVGLLKAVVALLPVSVLLAGSAVLFLRGKTLSSFLQLFGALCLTAAVLTHVCEALGLFPSTRWGRERSAGHYVDLWSAGIGVSLFFIGYLFHALARRNDQQA